MTDENDNAFSAYTHYASATEDLGDKRRGYAAILLPVQTALLVAPFFIDKVSDTTKFVLFIYSSVAGIVASAFWGTISKRYRKTIVYRYAWLATIESLLKNRSRLPNFARVYSFESIALFKAKPSFSPSKVEIRAALAFAFLFMFNPLAYSLAFGGASFWALVSQFLIAIAFVPLAAILILVLWSFMDDFDILKEIKSQKMAWFRMAFERLKNFDTPPNGLTDSTKQEIVEILEGKLADLSDVELNELLVETLQLKKKTNREGS